MDVHKISLGIYEIKAKMWEYKRIDFKFKNINDLHSILKKIGDDNWEIIFYQENLNEIKILAKRPTNEKNKNI